MNQTLYPTLTPALYPTLTPALYPTLTPALYPTLTSALYPTLNPALYPAGYPARRRSSPWLIRAALILAGLYLAMASARPVPARDTPAQSEDLAAIAALRDAGQDLSQPLWLEFAFYFPSLEGAQRAWNRLAGQGLKGKLEPAGGGRDYLLFASQRVLVDEPTLLSLRETFEALARENGGIYEGWGVP